MICSQRLIDRKRWCWSCRKEHDNCVHVAEQDMECDYIDTTALGYCDEEAWLNAGSSWYFTDLIEARSNKLYSLPCLDILCNSRYFDKFHDVASRLLKVATGFRLNKLYILSCWSWFPLQFERYILQGSSLPGAGTKGPDVLRFDLFNLEYLMKRNCWFTCNS